MKGSKTSLTALRLFLAASMVIPNVTLASSSAASAAPADTQGHWAQMQWDNWKDMDFIQGYEDGSLHPDATISRAEFIAIMNRVYGFERKADISFTDVKSGDWFYDDIAKAKAAGYITGYEDGTIKPNAPITRQEVAFIMEALMKSGKDKIDPSLAFDDENTISAWSKKAVQAVIAAGLMNGYPDHTFRPANPITRSEAVVTVDRSKQISAATVRYDKAGQFTQNTSGTVIIGAADVVLHDMVIDGNLIIADGVEEGQVTLRNVTVKGSTLIKGGGPNSVVLENSTLGKVDVRKKSGNVRVLATGTTSVQKLQMLSGGKLEDKSKDGKAFGQVLVDKAVPARSTISLSGTFDQISVQASDVTVQMDGKYNRLATDVAGKQTVVVINEGNVDQLMIGANTRVEIRKGTIENLTVPKGAGQVTIVAGEGVVIRNLTLDGPATVNGNGTIVNAVVNANNAQLEMKPQNVTLGDGVTVSIAGSPTSTGSTSGSGGGGGRHNSGSGVDRFAPGAPAELQAQAGDGQVTLNWKANTESDLKGYNVYVNDALKATVTAATYTVVGLTNGTEYKFSVSAIDFSGNESAKTELTATPKAAQEPGDKTPPAVPTGLQAQAGDAQVGLSWKANSEADLKGYNVYVNDALKATVTATTYAVIGLTNGTEYKFSVSAVDTNGNESAKTELTATPKAAQEPGDTTPPAVPTGLQAQAGDAQVSLSWKANSDADFKEYKVYVNDVLKTTLTATTYVVVGLTNGTEYKFSVSAVDISGNESAKTELTATPKAAQVPGDTTPPAIPAGLQAQAGDAQVSLSWTANSDADFKEYKVYVNDVLKTTLTGTTYAVVGLTNGTEYKFSVSAVDTSGNESAKTELKATPKAAQATPAVPTGLQAQVGDGQISLNWKANSEADFKEYKVYVNDVLKTTLTATTYAVVGLTNGTEYKLSVSAVNLNGIESAKTELTAVPVQGSKTVAEVRQLPDNTLNVKTTGIVTTAPLSTNKSFYMQDSTGGILVFTPTTTDTISIGDQVEVVGKKTTFSGEIEFDKGAVVKKLAASKVPAPVETSLDRNELLSKQGQLVIVKDITVSDMAADAKFTMNKDGQAFEAFLTKYSVKSGNLANGNVINVVGIVGIYSGNPQIYPRSEQDLGLADDVVVARDKQALDLGDTSAVVADLTLPTEGDNGSVITWTSSNPAIVDAAGKVVRPAKDQPAGQAILTATLTKGAVTDTKTFTLTVPAMAWTDAEAVAAVKNALTVSYDGQQDSVMLPVIGDEQVTISWALENQAQSTIVDTSTGTVNRQGLLADTTVRLIATISRSTASDTKIVTLTVQKDDIAPTITVLTQGNVIVGSKVTAKSNETGTLYLVAGSAAPTSKADLDQLVNGHSAQSSVVLAANTNVDIATDLLAEGLYKVYAVDAAGNVGVSSVSIALLNASSVLFIPTVNAVDDSMTTVTGMTKAAAKVTVKIGTQVLGTTTADNNGSYSVAIAPQSAGKVLEVSAQSGIVVSDPAYALVFSAATASAPQLTPDTVTNLVGSQVQMTFPDNTAWRGKITSVKVAGKALNSSQYTVSQGKLTINATAFPVEGSYSVVVNATGYKYATALQVVRPNVVLPPLAAPTGIVVNGTSVQWNMVPLASKYTVTIYSAGNAVKSVDTIVPMIDLSVQNLLTGSYTVKVKASANNVGFSDSVDSVESGSVTITNNQPPVFAASYPVAGQVGQTTADVKVKANKTGIVYYAVVADGAPALTGSDVKTKATNSDPLTGKSNITADTEMTLPITGLAPQTSYDVYVALEDAGNLIQPVAAKLDITTAAPDVTAPVLTISNTSVTSSTYGFNARANETGKVYYVVLSSGAAAPSSAQVKAGKDASDAAAFKNGSIDLTAANTDVPVTISGLTAGTNYDVYVIAVDAAGNQSAPTKLIAKPVVSQDRTNVIPVRTGVSGFSEWTDANILGTTYLQMTKNTATTVTPSMDFSQYSSIQLDFKARTYGGVDATKNIVKVYISQDNGATWNLIDSKTPTGTTLTAVATIDLSTYGSANTKIKFATPDSDGTKGVGIVDITISGIHK
ncbi:fibronectin type III domain-containing protein [Paenibacillus sp. RC67]|uniref:fibronectin type III domain-containing protein n=1 Tax=Paenibacillus sp. RC67 TaxID=3039392 RepID=UPI0024AD7627|nr:fibronectin type III domain-containing protein [Paenibacillus sp. RC67]